MRSVNFKGSTFSAVGAAGGAFVVVEESEQAAANNASADTAAADVSFMRLPRAYGARP
jgi:hypothetical protein